MGLDAPWPQHYGMWAADVAHVGLSRRCQQIWEAPEVVITEGERFKVADSYVLLDNMAVQAHLLNRLTAAGGDRTEGRIVAISRQGTTVTVSLANGTQMRCLLAIDAMGYRSPASGAPDPRVGWQTAWGEVRRGSPAEAMVLMDFSHTFDDAAEQPSFLYRLPMATGTLFEETVLVSSPAVSPDLLRERLRARMGWDTSTGDVLATERCEFAMGTPRRIERKDALGFGAAAGMIHPASGYSLGHVFRWAHDGAPELAALLERGVTEPTALARLWAWPTDRSRAHALYIFGMGVLAKMNLEQTRAFFRLFFSQSPEQALDYLRWRLSPDEVRALMWSMFQQGNAPARILLARAGLSASGLRMAWSQLLP
jgi:lycopene cyclase-like protein